MTIGYESLNIRIFLSSMNSIFLYLQEPTFNHVLTV